jgi:hypothetical protein
MRRHRLAWLATFALTAAGGVLAHGLVYAILGSGGAHAGHTAAGHWTLCLAICGVIALLGVAVFGACRAPMWIFGLVPPVGFALQAHLEWALAPGRGGYAAALGAAILLGVFVQIPFALAAYLAARGLLALVAAVVGRRPLRLARQLAGVALAPAETLGVLLVGPAFGNAQRAPPARLA